MWPKIKDLIKTYTQGSQVHAACVTSTLSFPYSKYFSFCCTFHLTLEVGGSVNIKIFVKNTWLTQKIQNILLLGKSTVKFLFNISFIYPFSKISLHIFTNGESERLMLCTYLIYHIPYIFQILHSYASSLNLKKRKRKTFSSSALLPMDCHSLWNSCELQTRAENHKEYKADIYDNSYRIHHEFM